VSSRRAFGCSRLSVRMGIPVVPVGHSQRGHEAGARGESLVVGLELVGVLLALSLRESHRSRMPIPGDYHGNGSLRLRDLDPAFEGTPVSTSALWRSCQARVPRAADLQAVTRLGW